MKISVKQLKRLVREAVSANPAPPIATLRSQVDDAAAHVLALRKSVGRLCDALLEREPAGDWADEVKRIKLSVQDCCLKIMDDVPRLSDLVSSVKD